MNGSQLTSTSFKAQLGLPDCLHENRKEESGGEQDNIGAAVDTAISKVLNAKVTPCQASCPRYAYRSSI